MGESEHFGIVHLGQVHLCPGQAGGGTASETSFPSY